MTVTVYPTIVDTCGCSLCFQLLATADSAANLTFLAQRKTHLICKGCFRWMPLCDDDENSQEAAVFSPEVHIRGLASRSTKVVGSRGEDSDVQLANTSPPSRNWRKSPAYSLDRPHCAPWKTVVFICTGFPLKEIQHSGRSTKQILLGGWSLYPVSVQVTCMVRLHVR